MSALEAGAARWVRSVLGTLFDVDSAPRAKRPARRGTPSRTPSVPGGTRSRRTGQARPGPPTRTRPALAKRPRLRRGRRAPAARRLRARAVQRNVHTLRMARAPPAGACQGWPAGTPSLHWHTQRATAPADQLDSKNAADARSVSILPAARKRDRDVATA